MLQTSNFLPHIYTKESRDFQYFEHLYDIALNEVALNVHLMKEAPYTNMETLLLNTYGFHDTVNETNKTTQRLAENLSDLFHNKGTEYAIKKLFIVLCNSEGIRDTPTISIKNRYLDSSKQVKITEIQLTYPSKLSFYSVALAEKLLEYLLPVNCLFTLHRADIVAGYRNSLSVINTCEAESLSDNTTTSVYEFNSSGAANVKNMTQSHIGGTKIQQDAQKTGDIRFSRVNKE